MARIVPIVEGHGDREAVPVLIRRVVAEFCPEAAAVDVARPVLVPKTKLLQAGDLERRADLAVAALEGQAGGMLVVIDADGDQACVMGPELLERVRTARADLAVEVVLAEREFEGWGLAAAESLRGWRGLPDDLEPPRDPQAVRGAKEWLTGRMPGVYSPTADQASLAATIDLRAAQEAASSFGKFRRAVCALAALS